MSLKAVLAVVWSIALCFTSFVAGCAYREHMLFESPRITNVQLSLSAGTGEGQSGVLPRGTVVYDLKSRFEPPLFAVVLATKRMDAMRPAAGEELRGTTPLGAY